MIVKENYCTKKKIGFLEFKWKCSYSSWFSPCWVIVLRVPHSKPMIRYKEMKKKNCNYRNLLNYFLYMGRKKAKREREECEGEKWEHFSRGRGF